MKLNYQPAVSGIGIKHLIERTAQKTATSIEYREFAYAKECNHTYSMLDGGPGQFVEPSFASIEIPNRLRTSNSRNTAFFVNQRAGQ